MTLALLLNSSALLRVLALLALPERSLSRLSEAPKRPPSDPHGILFPGAAGRVFPPVPTALGKCFRSFFSRTQGANMWFVLNFVKGESTFVHVSAIPCCNCRQLVAEEFLEGGRCIGCKQERDELFKFARQSAIDGTQVSRRTSAVSGGQARRFMGRFSSTLKRSR